MAGAVGLAITSCTVPAGEPAGAAGPVQCGSDAVRIDGVEPAPGGDLPGWRPVFVDDFERCELGEDWAAYSGQPGGDPLSWWEPDRVSVGGGVLRLGIARFQDQVITGGASNDVVAREYGRWEVRLRVDRGQDVSYHVLLWPQDEQWPPEIDIAESIDGDRRTMSSFVHWRDGEERFFAQADTEGVFDEWHTVGVEWLPGRIRYLLDGEPWAELDVADHVPAKPMWLAIQAQAGACEKRDSWGMPACGPAEDMPGAVNVDVDWVTVHEPVWEEVPPREPLGDAGAEFREIGPFAIEED
ncbi:glycoside hydrolase family 16 protein [Lolliginicoccus levis]|uniref:glycoside hydrolase family 16 protein n=1 Tax=Lolliginicoccus levis TaxID=2919542 RepID=UPI00241DC18E|nr:glycoside hydrolase family 16 protein [Lolliginicoccus levis]